MFNKTEAKKDSFLEKRKAARCERANERAYEESKQKAILVLQKNIRGWIIRVQFKKRILSDFDALFPNEAAKELELKPSIQVYHCACRFLLQWKNDKDNDLQKDRLEHLCRYLIASLESDSPKFSYIGVALNKDYSLMWIRHIKKLLYKCCVIIETLKPECHSDSISLALYLHTLVTFTSPNSWTILKNKGLAGLKPGMTQLCSNILGDLIQKGFFITLRSVLIKGICRSVATLKPISLTALLTLAMRPLIYANFTENILSMFVVHILSVPGLIYQLEHMSQESLSNIQTHQMLEKTMDLIGGEESLKFIINSSGSQLLALLSNLVHMFYLENHENAVKLSYPSFVFAVTKLLQGISKNVGQTAGTCSQWHELLGWFTPGQDKMQNENLAIIKKQIHLLWNHRMVKILFGDCLKEFAEGYEVSEYAGQNSNSSANLLKRALTFERSTSKGQISKANKTFRKLGSNEVTKVALISTMYHSSLTTMSQLKLDILSGLCYNDSVLHDQWILLASLGPSCGIKSFLEVLQVNQSSYAPQILMLSLFCDCMTHYVTILDDMEMYEQQTPFTLNDYIVMSNFLNTFLYKVIQDQIIDVKFVATAPIFVSAHTLLLCLYRRDCRRSFAPVNHWLIKDARPSNFLNDLEKGKKHTQVLLQKMPHIIPHDDRVQLFRKFVQNEKAVLGLTESACASPTTSALVTVHRDRIVEDGYRQLAALPPHALKGVIRVRFVNQQGLDEAGIDQDGVFKEFLEETIKRVFDPSLNLFKTTTEQRLYPSPTSCMQDNHLQLFEFVGRMLGKAVYEGIVVDVPFALFFLSQLLGQTQQALYSCMDELPSLDKELYRSLTFIKHYQGDVIDLDLTFSTDEDVMGKIVTHELHPGGKARLVNNDNKINYIHYMAYFRMHTQIREQTAAFIRGFRSIINPDWLALFSTPELQRLISGDTAPLDLKDLRKHTQYYGGFHDSHRVVGWLWDILAKDFTEEEQKLFLKFVTSCSKPPLLGFAHLEPPFSIRCVEVGDDEDIGDTVGSVIRGFFTIRKKDLNRLPTSSTCFNLLKLPNYQKKGMLRDKLRYAISSNTGFELS